VRNKLHPTLVGGRLGKISPALAESLKIIKSFRL